jgi:glycosyltransferase involved in cell wall biosynthesis
LFVATGKQLREFCTLLERYTQPKYHALLAGWQLELSAMVDRKIAEMRDPFPEEFARDRVELEGYVRRARESIARIPAIGEATLRGDGLISVVVPFHGRIGPLQRALASLKAQTYERWEAIVVADSTFDPSDVIAWMGLADRVRVARSRTMHGPASSRNLGIGGVNGEIVAYLDEDNRYDPGYLRSVATALADPAIDATVAGARFAVVSPDGAVLSSCDLGATTGQGGAVSWICNAVPLNCVAHRRSCIAAIGGAFNVTLNLLEDWEFLLRLDRTYPLKPLRDATVEIDTDVWLRGHHLFGRRTGAEWSEYASLVQAIYGGYPSRSEVETKARAEYAGSLQAVIQRGVNAAGSPAGVAQFVLALAGIGTGAPSLVPRA